MPKITFAPTKIFISNLEARKHLVSCTTLWLVPNISKLSTYKQIMTPSLLLRLCLVRVKPFPERKTFSCVWLSQNSFYGKLILVFGSFKYFTRKCIKSGKTLVRRAARSTIAIASLDRRSHSAISSIAIVHRAARRRGAARSGLSLSDLGSLSLSLSPEVIWSENEGRKSFPGQRWKYWSIGSHFPENDIFRDSQTLRFYGKWFPETAFTQFKHILKL